MIYIDPGQPVPNMDITISIIESREITDLKVPPLRNDVMAAIEGTSNGFHFLTYFLNIFVKTTIFHLLYTNHFGTFRIPRQRVDLSDRVVRVGCVLL